MRGDGQAQTPVVHEQRGAGKEDGKQLWMRERHPLRVSRAFVEIEPERLAGVHFHGPSPAEPPEPEFRPLEVEKDPDWASLLLFDGADELDPAEMVRRLSVAEVEPEEIRSGPKQRRDDLVLIARRPQGGHDLGLARTPHGSLPAEPP